MPTLYILGNGFDTAHSLKASYWHFRNYLEEYAEDFLTSFEKMYGFQPIDPYDWRTERNWKQIKAQREAALKEKLWRSFEADLGSADEAEMIAFSESIVDDLDLDSGPIGIEGTMNHYWEEQYQFIKALQGYVHRWVRQIRINKAAIQKQRLYQNQEDFFLTFNYTSVLERIYQIPSHHILHIHGGLSPYCSTEPILGHGNFDVIEKYSRLAKEADAAFDEGAKSIYNAISIFYHRMFKDSERIRFLHNEFFAALRNVDTVEIIGHSLGDVDMPYFRSVKEAISVHAVWNVYYFNPDDESSFKQTILSLDISEEQVSTKPASDFWDPS